MPRQTRQFRCRRLRSAACERVEAGTAVHGTPPGHRRVRAALEEKDKRQLDPNVESKIDALWADRYAVKLIEFHGRRST